MKLLLDARISGPRVGEALKNMGHDVKATERMERLPDEVILEMAVEEGRVLITRNVKDFYQLARERPPEKNHSGRILIPPSVQLHSFGEIISGIQRTLGDLSQDGWANRVEWMRKGSGHPSYPHTPMRGELTTGKSISVSSQSWFSACSSQ